MKLGFIGTGKITSSVITGICNSSIKYNRIFVSSRNNKISKNLKKRFKKISIEKNNQKIIDSCSWIFLAVTTTVGKKILKDLKFRSNQKITAEGSLGSSIQRKRKTKQNLKLFFIPSTVLFSINE